MRQVRVPGLAILVVLAALACGERRETAAPPATPAQAPAAPAPAAAPQPQALAGAPAEGAPAAEEMPAATESATPPGTAPPPVAEAATIEFELYKAGFIVGVSGGRGTLHYEGSSHPLKIGGVSVGVTAGVSKAELLGSVRNLRRLADIEGTYTATQAGLALGGGAKITRLENGRGVVLEVRGRQMGIELSLDLNGMQISLGK